MIKCCNETYTYYQLSFLNEWIRDTITVDVGACTIRRRFFELSWDTVKHNVSAFCPLCYRIARQTADTLLNTHTHHSIRAAVMVSLGLNYQYDRPLNVNHWYRLDTSLINGLHQGNATSVLHGNWLTSTAWSKLFISPPFWHLLAKFTTKFYIKVCTPKLGSLFLNTFSWPDCSLFSTIPPLQHTSIHWHSILLNYFSIKFNYFISSNYTIEYTSTSLVFFFNVRCCISIF